MEDVVTLRKQLKSSLDEYLAAFESSPYGIHILSELGLNHTDLGLESPCLNMDWIDSTGVNISINPGFSSDHEMSDNHFILRMDKGQSVHDHVDCRGLDLSIPMEWSQEIGDDLHWI